MFSVENLILALNILHVPIMSYVEIGKRTLFCMSYTTRPNIHCDQYFIHYAYIFPLK